MTRRFQCMWLLLTGVLYVLPGPALWAAPQVLESSVLRIEFNTDPLFFSRDGALPRRAT